MTTEGGISTGETLTPSESDVSNEGMIGETAPEETSLSEKLDGHEITHAETGETPLPLIDAPSEDVIVQVTDEGTSVQNVTDHVHPEQQQKLKSIISALWLNDKVSLEAAAVEDGGLISDEIRRKAWPILMGIDIYDTSLRPIKADVERHPYYEQVLLDVNRSLKRFPPSIREFERLAMQDQLVFLIMRVLMKHPTFHYYQGYHDICVTFLLVLGEEMSFHVMEKLSLSNLDVFMRKTMDPTLEMLYYIYPIIRKEKPKLCEFLEKSEAGVVFSLSWVITWFGHVLNKYSDVVRLYDFFMVSDALMPVYLSACIVLHREAELLKQECDMASVHSFLLNIPEDLPFEKLIKQSVILYSRLPPDTLKDSVKELLEKHKRKQMVPVKDKAPSKNVFLFVYKAIKYILPNKVWSISLAVAVIAVLSGIMYQSYKNNN